ncbi:ACP S-malonyltransferase [Candidatus Pelagibacter sp.]|nr:ACP S-malonyltransferase [Candidatus Pelagibacter sp.]|tara:strand:- start:715 stop:1644 length:930 start_codon:yes stop_codon:yes gene_type:complete
MFSVLFPGQGSQNIGMAKDLIQNFSYIKDYFLKANEILNKDLSKIIIEGPKETLDQTENTQPAIFLVSYSLFKIIENETQFKIKNAKYFAGHSLGEYSALCCGNAITFEQTIKLLKLRGEAMQNAVPSGKGGMIAILGKSIDDINNILEENRDRFVCYLANDNSNGQAVISGLIKDIKMLEDLLSKKNIKFVNLSVSAPFHCPLMKNATEEMRELINNTEFKNPMVDIVSNVTANPLSKSEEIKNFLIEQIEKPVRWRESINNMISLGVTSFIEIGPGKVLSGLIKRIDRNVKLNNVNNLTDAKSLIND